MKFWKKLGIFCMMATMTASTALMATACGTDDPNVIELNEVTHSVFYAPLYVAINQGYFEDEGLTVNLTNGGGSDTSMTALLTGSADIILAGPETVVYTEQEGSSKNPTAFGQLTQYDGSFIVSKDPIADFSLDDLVGETIIGGRAGGLPAMTLEHLITSNGYEIGTGADQINLRTDVDFNLTASVWDSSDDIKFCTLFEPTATNIAKQYNAHIVSSVGELSDFTPFTAFIATSEYLQKNEEVATKFIKAVLKGYEYIANNTASSVAEVLKPSFEANTLQELETTVEQYLSIDAWSSDLVLSEEAFENLIDIMLNAEVITERTAWEDVVDNSIPNSFKTLE